MLDRRMGRVLECVTCGPRYIKIKIVGPWFESECLFVCRQESLQSESRFLCVHNNLSNLEKCIPRRCTVRQAEL